jgi:hypothetical protein
MALAATTPEQVEAVPPHKRRRYRAMVMSGQPAPV